MAVHLRLRWFAIMGRNPRLSKCAIRPAKNYPARLPARFFSWPLGTRFIVTRQFFDELHRALLREARNLQPHDFGAFFLADKAVRIGHGLANHRPRRVVGRWDCQRLSERRCLWKFPQHRVSLDPSIFKISAPAFGDIAYSPDREAPPIATGGDFEATPIRSRRGAAYRIIW